MPARLFPSLVHIESRHKPVMSRFPAAIASSPCDEGEARIKHPNLQAAPLATPWTESTCTNISLVILLSLLILPFRRFIRALFLPVLSVVV